MALLLGLVKIKLRCVIFDAIYGWQKSVGLTNFLAQIVGTKKPVPYNCLLIHHKYPNYPILVMFPKENGLIVNKSVSSLEKSLGIQLKRQISRQ